MEDENSIKEYSFARCAEMPESPVWVRANNLDTEGQFEIIGH